jgi:hypothetical protein
MSHSMLGECHILVFEKMPHCRVTGMPHYRVSLTGMPHCRVRGMPHCRVSLRGMLNCRVSLRGMPYCRVRGIPYYLHVKDNICSSF